VVNQQLSLTTKTSSVISLHHHHHHHHQQHFLQMLHVSKALLYCHISGLARPSICLLRARNLKTKIGVNIFTGQALMAFEFLAQKVTISVRVAPL